MATQRPTLTGKIVTPEGIVEGSIRLRGDKIAAIAPGPVPADAPWFVPGFVDMHVHGGGGHTFTTGDPESAREAAAFHLRHGTTTLLASLVSSPPEVMTRAVAAFAPLVAEGVVAGVHFEGPYLSEACCGAQNPAFLRDPSLDEVRTLLRSGIVKMMTIAPERPGALAAIEALVEGGAVAAIGHTDATYGQVLDGVAAGATVGTHVFNGMRPPHHRAPGPVYALLGAPEVTCEFIADGVHSAEETLSFAFGVVGPDRAALITDAMTATGMADGRYELSGLSVVVDDGVARLDSGTVQSRSAASGGAIAGSTLTMDAAFRRAARVMGSVAAASRAASGVPAAALGLTDRGAIAPGQRADILTIGADLAIISIIRGGLPVPMN